MVPRTASHPNRNRNRARDHAIRIRIEQQARVASRDDLPSTKRWDAVNAALGQLNAALGQLNALVGKRGTVVPKFLIMSEIAQTVRCFVYGYCPQYLHPVVDALALWAVVLTLLASSNHKIPSKYEVAIYVTLTIVSVYIIRGLIMKMARWLCHHFFNHLASSVHNIWKRITGNNNGATSPPVAGRLNI